jgi:predicted metal-dependent hydrolase
MFREDAMRDNRANLIDLTITPRDRTFSREPAPGRYWLGDDPIATAFYDALSATFPLGERFFMDSVRRYGHLAGQRLGEQIAGFLAQEAVHSREHVFFNRGVAGHGYDVAAMEARTRVRLAFVRTRPPLVQLAATVALEHFTAILAHALLSDPRHMDAAESEARAMWRWHAMEEIEHKAVAFDTFLLVTRGRGDFRRWTLRCFAMVTATFLLFSNICAGMASMFETDGIDGPRTWGRVLIFLFGRPGILRQIVPDYLRFYRPGFHPWELDDLTLLNETRASVGRPQPA